MGWGVIEERQMKAKVSVGSSAFAFGVYASNPVPLDRLTGKLEELGFQGIELLGMKPYGDPDELKTIADRKSLVKKFRGHGLDISNYGADFHERSPASNDPEERADYHNIFTKNLQFCADCEIPSIRVDTVHEPPLTPGVSYDDAWRRMVEGWQQCAERAEKEEVLVVWEFEPGFMFNKPGEIVKMMKDVNHRNFKILYDSCHAHMCAAVGARQEEPKDLLPGGEIELAWQLKGHIGYVHLIDSDNTLHDSWTSTHAPFGTGVIDFDTLLDAMAEAEYRDEWWTIDLCFWSKAWEVLADSKSFVDDLLTRHHLL
jgi:sugar phosphate isomerase/epimerase